MTQSSRKRSRSCDEEGCEFMPISKRINKLHIRSGQLTSDEEGQEDVRLASENTNGNGCVVIADGPLHCGSSDGFLHSNDGGHRGTPSSFGSCENATLRLSPNENCCAGATDGAGRVGQNVHSHHHYQSQINGGSTSGMNSVSSSSSMSQLYQQPQQIQDGADHVMDDGGGGRCQDDRETPASRLRHEVAAADDILLESQLQALTRMHQQMQDMSQVAEYDPGLTESENPFYYQVNEMLYRLHVLRMQRMTKNDG